jgi:hypothetical protein
MKSGREQLRQLSLLRSFSLYSPIKRGFFHWRREILKKQTCVAPSLQIA